MYILFCRNIHKIFPDKKTSKTKNRKNIMFNWLNLCCSVKLSLVFVIVQHKGGSKAFCPAVLMLSTMNSRHQFWKENPPKKWSRNARHPLLQEKWGEEDNFIKQQKLFFILFFPPKAHCLSQSVFETKNPWKSDYDSLIVTVHLIRHPLQLSSPRLTLHWKKSACSSVPGIPHLLIKYSECYTFNKKNKKIQPNSELETHQLQLSNWSLFLKSH